MLTTGAFSPLDEFMGREDYESCLKTMRLADGQLFPVPVTLPVDEPYRAGSRIALVHSRGDILASVEVDETFEVDVEAELVALLGSRDPGHPYTQELRRGSRLRIGGKLNAYRPAPHADFVELRLGPDETRRRLLKLGRRNVVAFQTRNPLHRSHEELIKRAARDHAATILLHPVVGLTKAGDVDHFTRVRAYRATVKGYFDPGTTLLALLPLAMRMAGPREALLHAIIRKNFGATHFIVGRDHAGPGLDSCGRAFFDPYAAQDLVGAHAEEIGISMVRFREMLYLEDEDRYEEEDKIPPGASVRSLSGSDVRKHLLAGHTLPAWFTRPEAAAVLQQAYPPRTGQGFCVWLTGLSGAGKSAVADALRALLMERGRTVTLLDGDEVRLSLSKGLGFSREDRDTNILRIGFVASEVVRHGGVAICAAISPFRGARDQCRALMGDAFVEVFVDTSLAICEARDSKGLYARARAGDLRGFTGIDDPYEEPLSPDVRLADAAASPVDNARSILRTLQASGFLGRESN